MSHLAETTWEQLAMNELAPGARAEALRHVMACERCRTIFHGLRALEDAAKAEDLLPAKVAAPTRAPARRWIAAGAVAVAAAAAVILYVRRPEDDRTLRGNGSAALAVDCPERVRAGDRVSWSAVANADGYRLELFTEDGTPAWSQRTTATAIAWPAAPKPGVYRLRVEALAGGVAASRSTLIRVEVVP
jgi:hypothetical protein